MSIDTYSGFTYGHTITDDNKFLNFDEGSGELTAQLEIGSYTLGEFANEVVKAMNNVGSLEYSFSLDRTTRKITISSTANFDLLISSGSNSSVSVFSLIGFTGADLTGLQTYESNNSSGEYFEPQNILQSFVDFKHNIKTTTATVNESASGIVEVVSYGKVRFMKCNIAPQTNITGQGSIKNDAQGVENLTAFLNYITTKAKIEFIPDITNPNLNIKDCIIETTKTSKKGVDFEVKMFKKLFGYFESGSLEFREI